MSSVSVNTKTVTKAVEQKVVPTRRRATVVGVTPHALRRTYISLMLEAGAPLPYVMDQVEQ